jgi:hypothetical protein
LGEQQANLLVTFILNYGFIPFTLLVFDTLRAVNGVVAAIFSLAATATNFMLTLTLNDEIFSFLNSLLPCRPQPIGLAVTAAILFLIDACVLYFSSMIYLPDAFAESIADCAFIDGIDNITFESNVTIPCPANSPAWFGVQLVLAVANPFLYNMALLMFLAERVYKAMAGCLAKRYRSYQAAAAWIRFREQSVRKLQGALRDEEFLARFTRMMLRDDDLRELYCARAYEGVPVVNKLDDPASANAVLRDLAGDKSVVLPDGFAHTKPFKSGCWQWVYWLKELPVMAVSIYYWNSYDTENSVNPTPHLPRLGDGLTAFIVLSGVWLSSIIPLVIDAIRLGRNKNVELSVYQENSKPFCGSNQRVFGLVRPILSKLRYFGWQAMAAVLTAPLLIGVYHLAVTMLEAAIELNLHALAPEVESITAMAFQGFVLAGLAGMIRQVQDSVVRLGLTASCNRRAKPGDEQFPSLATNLWETTRPVTFVQQAAQPLLNT